MPKTLQNVNTRIFREWLPGTPDYEMAAGCSIEWYDNGPMNSEDYKSAICNLDSSETEVGEHSVCFEIQEFSLEWIF